MVSVVRRRVRVWDEALGSLVTELTGLDGPVLDLLYSQEHRCLITLTRPGTVQTWPLPPLGQALLDLAWERCGAGGELLTHAQRVRFDLEER